MKEKWRALDGTLEDKVFNLCFWASMYSFENKVIIYNMWEITFLTYKNFL